MPWLFELLHDISNHGIDYVCLWDMLTLNPVSYMSAWIINYIDFKAWDELTYPFPNSTAVEV